jgi:hypothetical protein
MGELKGDDPLLRQPLTRFRPFVPICQTSKPATGHNNNPCPGSRLALGRQMHEQPWLRDVRPTLDAVLPQFHNLGGLSGDDRFGHTLRPENDLGQFLLGVSVANSAPHDRQNEH